MDWLEFTSQEYNSLYGVLSRFIGPFHGESRHVKNQPDENQKGTILTTLDGPLTPERSGSHLYIPQKRSWGLPTLIAAKKARPFLKKKLRASPSLTPGPRPKNPQKSWWLSHAAHDDGEKLWKGFPPVGQRMLFWVHLWQGILLAVVSLKITFPNITQMFLLTPFQLKLEIMKTLLFGLYFVDRPLHPQTAPPAYRRGTYGGLFYHLEWVVGPYKSQFKNDLPTQMSYQILSINSIISTSLGFGRTLPFVCWICVSRLIPGYGLVFFNSCNPSPTHWMNPFKKRWNKMSSHSFENKGKSCKFSGRVFLFPPVKKNPK